MAQEVQRKTILATGLASTLVKNGVAFCPCAENFPEAKLKSSGLLSLVKISSLPNIGSVIRLLVITPMRIYNEKEIDGKCIV